MDSFPSYAAYDQPDERPSTVKRFFFACAGAYLRILEVTPSEHAKYVGIGATIFLTGCLAIISGSFAVYTLVPNVLVAIPAGLLWGALIFNLDRYIVSSIRKEGKSWQEFGMALPRLILAVLISLVITKPIEVELFANQINSELYSYVADLEKDATHTLDHKLGLDSIRSEMVRLDSMRHDYKDRKSSRPNSFTYDEASGEYRTAKQRYDSLANLYLPLIKANKAARNNLWTQYGRKETVSDEAGNTRERWVLPPQYQTRNVSLYSQSKQYEETLGEAEKDLQSVEKVRQSARQEFSESVEEELTMLQTRRDELNDARIEAEAMRKAELPDALEKARKYGVGFPAKIQALERMKEHDSSIWWMSNMIVLLFIMLETSPVFVKLITKRGPYDYLLSRIEHQRKVESLRQISDMNYDLNATMRLRSRQAQVNGTPRKEEPMSEN
jgi:hypothetical protein